MSFLRLSAILFLFPSWLCCLAYATDPSPLHIGYFVPSDRKPCPKYEERLDRVMTEVQDFYRKGMKDAGFGPMTFELERDDNRRLKIHLVQGDHPTAFYDRNSENSENKVREEVKSQLKLKGVDIDQETIVIFQALLRWEEGKATEVGAYCGGGNYLAGTAWVYDDELLDPRLLSSKAPGGFYNGPCSIGEFNSHYIGGVAHELGHAFGLPHDCQRQADHLRGTSLMGGGNHTYGQELRKEGLGTFLTATSAMPLVSCRRFAAKQEAVFKDANSELNGFEASFKDGKIVLSGTLRGEPRAYGIVAYNDFAEIQDDYDAVGWVGKISENGKFQVEIGELHPGKFQLRLCVCRSNAEPHIFSFDYAVDRDGKPDLDVFRHAFSLHKAIRANVRGDKTRATLLAQEFKKRFSEDAEIQRKTSRLLALMQPSPLIVCSCAGATPPLPTPLRDLFACCWRI